MVQKELLEKIDSPRFSVFVVWLPVLGADSYQQAQQAQSIFSDARAKQWWDDNQALGQSYRKILLLASDCRLAWDVYLLYRSGVKRFRYSFDSDGKKGWTPPAPGFWMHQLSCMTKEQFLDSNLLHEKIQTMLGENKSTQ